MNREIGETIKIAIELMVTAILIGVIVVFSNLSEKTMEFVERDKSVQQLMQAHSELYHYNNKVVRGADVIDCILKYPRSYTFRVIIGSNTYVFNDQNEISSGLGLDLWSAEYIENVVVPSQYTNMSFHARFIMNSTHDVIEGIEFEME